MSRILIVYYSVTSRTRHVAEIIQRIAGGDSVSLRLKVPYNKKMLDLWKAGHREIKEIDLPELNDFPVDLNEYDVIFLGSPIWRYSVAAPMRSFLATHDLAGKTICPFVTGDYAIGSAFFDLMGMLKNGFVKTGLQVRFIDDRQVTPDRQIENWVKNVIREI